MKPANIKITPDGTAKVLDFGLAKAIEREASANDISKSPTISFAATQAGMILGTAAYMSPEQAKGKAVDRRADIWAFGCVLYEMLTGRQAFEGETTSDILAAVIRGEPDWKALPPNTPASIRKLLRRCLNKDPKHRLQAIGDARIAIEETMSGEDVGAGLVPALGRPQGSPLQPVWQRALPWALAGLFAIIAVSAIWIAHVSGPSGTGPAQRMQFAIPARAEVRDLGLSSDGRMLTYVAREDASGENMLYVERLGSSGATLLAGTEGAYYPFWSPDGANLGFFAGGKLKKIALSGGAPQAIATVSSARGGSWGSRGVILYSPDAPGGLWRVNADGSGAAPLLLKLVAGHEASHRWPVFLPDGDHFLFWAGNFSGGREDQTIGIYLSTLGSAEKKLLVPARSNPGYAGGHLYYADDKLKLMAVSLDASTAKITGEPLVIADRVAYQPSVYGASFSVGGNDTVVYDSSSGAALSALTWYDRTGKMLGQIGEPGVLSNPSLSPDGSRATVDIADLKVNNVDIWIENLARIGSSRFTFLPAEEVAGVWSRDGETIAYRAIVKGGIIELKKASGLEPQRALFASTGQGDIIPNSWTLGDKQVLCTSEPTNGGSHLVLVDVATGGMVPFLATQANETNGQISLDGKWVAYASNESSDWEIYVTTFPNPTGKWQVSRGGGTEPRWRRDGHEIFYIDLKGVLTAVSVIADGAFSTGAPSPLFPLHGRSPISSTDLFTYDVAPDGQRFLINRYVKPDHVQLLSVVLNAAAMMKK